MRLRNLLPLAVSGFLIGCVPTAQQDNNQSKDASEFTRKANDELYSQLNFSDTQDFVDARRGFIAPLPNQGIIKNSQGEVIFDAARSAFPLDADAPATINPSLWRQVQLNGITGLFQVAEGVYQVRGLNVSNMTLIETARGVIVADPLVTSENSSAALALYHQHRPGRPVVAVIYTHGHVDHFAGVRGVITEKDALSGKVKVIAPNGFLDQAIMEDVFVGNAMSRRSQYFYGTHLPYNERGNIGVGLGVIGSSGGTQGFIAPTDLITHTGQKMTIDGLEIEFMLPGNKTSSETGFYIPAYKALCAAENACHTMHNIYTLRGAKTRDAARWFHGLDEVLALWGDRAEVLFMAHTWPVWGNARLVDYIEKYRDALRYIHDRTLHLANQGYTMDEIAEMMVLPDELNKNWATRGYYGSVGQNAKGIYNFYLGYFGGNPADLNLHTPVERAHRYVAAIGGEEEVLKLARAAANAGDYRWAAELLKHIVLVNPDNTRARNLQADVFEQLGYQAESATWRGFYLSGAQELREGVKREYNPTSSLADMLLAIPMPKFLDYLAIRLDGPRASNVLIVINLTMTDTKETYAVTVRRGVLNYREKLAPKADLSLTLSKVNLGRLLSGEGKIDQMVKEGQIVLEGNPARFAQLFDLMDDFDPLFNIVTP